MTSTRATLSVRPAPRRVRVTAGLLGWAEAVFVMESRHADWLQARFGTELRGKRPIMLRIPDHYQFQDRRWWRCCASGW